MLLQIIDVMVGMSVVYLIFSTVASALAEFLEQALRRRGQLLQKGVQELLFSQAEQVPHKVATVNAALHAFYTSPPIAALFQGKAVQLAHGQLAVQQGQLPSYIPAGHFAAAVQHLAASSDDPEVRRLFEKLRSTALDVQPSSALPGAATAVPDAATSHLALTAFYDGVTDRIAGWYRRHVQAMLFIIGLGLALALNIDSLHLLQTFSQNQEVRNQVVENYLRDSERQALSDKMARDADKANAASDTPVPQGMTTPPANAADPFAVPRREVQAALAMTEALGIPIGWKYIDFSGGNFGTWFQRILGWLLTAVALCVGAPFWFDLLNHLTNLRSTLKPKTAEPAQGNGPEAKTVD